jgi:hypothetical protein
MPQPLNRVISNGEFRPNPDVLSDKPELAKLVASIFALWASIEHLLSLLLVRVLGADPEPAIAIFATLKPQRLQLGALKAAAKAALSVDDFDVFCAAISLTDSVLTPRNHLAHWIWGDCEQLSEALLLAEPKARKEQDQKMIAAIRRLEKGPTTSMLDEIFKLYRYDPATVWVYRRGDLERAKRDLEDVERIARLLTVYLDRQLWQMPSSHPEWERARSIRNTLFELLREKRLFAEALDQMRVDRQTDA